MTSKMFMSAVTLLAAALLTSFPAQGQEVVSCPCGTTGKNYTFRNIDQLRPEEICRTWTRCVKCQDEVYYCLDCPVGMFGPSCSDRERNPNICLDPGLPLNGLRTVRWPTNHRQSGSAFPFGTHLKYSCIEGYERYGWGSLVCLSGGKWSSASLPHCNKERNRNWEPQTNWSQCSNPGTILNGYMVPWIPPDHWFHGSRPEVDPDKFLEGSSITYSCEDLHKGQGTRRITCESTGFWSAEPPKCVEDRCRLTVKSYQMQSHGYHATAGEWPFMVGIASLSNGSSQINCGGVLINNRTVLTAASCFLRDNVHELVFGKYRHEKEADDDQVMKRTHFTVEIHPNFNNITYAADIALVHFWPGMNYTDRIHPICYPTNENTARNLTNGRNGYVISWGLNDDLKILDGLVMSRYNVVTTDSCIKEQERNNIKVSMDIETFCAETSEAPINTCNGYGGSPIVFFDPIKGAYFVEGLVRADNSISCNQPRRYTFFTQVAPYVPWILENLH